MPAKARTQLRILQAEPEPPSEQIRNLWREYLRWVNSAKEARQVGCTTLRLDSARFMNEAQALYRSAGFRYIDLYAESEIPEEYRPYWIFMEKALA